MQELSAFEFNLMSVRFAEIDNETWFVAKDVALQLEYRDASTMTRNLDEDEVSDTHLLCIPSPDNNRAMKMINESGLYNACLKAKTERAKPFRKKVTSEILPKIRREGQYSIQNNQPERKQIKECIEGLGAVAEMLNISESGKLKMIRDYAQENAVEIIPGLPSYTVDAPKSAVLNASQGSAWVTFSATDLLKNKGYDIGARKFNKLAEDHGFIERKTRHNKTFPVVTEEGMEFGKNLVSDKDARIVQPHWYENKFDELMEILLD